MVDIRYDSTGANTIENSSSYELLQNPQSGNGQGRLAFSVEDWSSSFSRGTSENLRSSGADPAIVLGRGILIVYHMCLCCDRCRNFEDMRELGSYRQHVHESVQFHFDALNLVLGLNFFASACLTFRVRLWSNVGPDIRKHSKTWPRSYHGESWPVDIIVLVKWTWFWARTVCRHFSRLCMSRGRSI